MLLVKVRGRFCRWSALLAVVWLLFFPNAHYLVTDLIHFKTRPPIPLWFDGTLLTLLAIVGVLLGAASLAMMRDLVQRQTSPAGGWWFTILTSFAAGFGVYLGRFERWNSWDILHHPFLLLGHIADVLLNPMQHPEPWFFTAQFGGFIFGTYLLAHWLWFRKRA
jgi:uncharacterized membrane protein